MKDKLKVVIFKGVKNKVKESNWQTHNVKTKAISQQKQPRVI